MSKKKYYVKKYLFLLFITCSSIASATKYYVSSSTGNNDLDGKSEANAWKTLSKVNGSTFSAGDSIYFKKGDTWRETLEIPSGGNPSAYLYFGNYGTGNNPRILGSVATTTWTDQGGNIWKSDNTFINPRSLYPYYCDLTFNSGGVERFGAYKSATSSMTAEYNWTWSSNYIYVYSPTNPATRYTGIEVPQRLFCISTNSNQYIHIDGIDGFYSADIGFDTNSDHSDDINIKGCIVENCEVGFIGGITGNTFGFGMSLVYSDLIIRNCEIHHCGRRGLSLDLIGSGTVFTAKNALIENNIFHHGYHTTALDCNVNNGGNNASWDSIIFRRNMVYEGENESIYAGSNQIFLQQYNGTGKLSNVIIYSNIFKFSNASAINIEKTESTYIYNNVFYGHNTTGAQLQHLYVNENAKNVVSKNNIFYSSVPVNTSGWEFVVYNNSTSAITSDYNLYYRLNNSLRILLINGTSYYMSQLSSIRSNYGWETHSPIPSDPLFFSTDNLHVQGGSPALGSGISIPGITVDYEGNTFSDPPNIGCYATPVVTSTPNYLGAVVENVAPTIVEVRYNVSLANVVPAASSFTVMVNGSSRTVNSVAISGAKVLLTLASKVAYGDIVNVSYTKPATNFIQSSLGVEADPFSAKTVNNYVKPASPVYVSSVVENSTPSTIQITYDLTLANIIPAASAFSVMVNSIARSVTNVSISGTKVLLTLAFPVVYGNTVTLAYNKPVTNPLQTSTGGMAETISAKTVTNNVGPESPVYLSSVIQNVTPSIVEINFSLSLISTPPDGSAFGVTVNSVSRSVISVLISGSKVKLSLTNPVANDDVILLSYAKPATNPLQTSSGGMAANFSSKTVRNNVGVANVPPVVKVEYTDNFMAGFVGDIDASGSTDDNGDILYYDWTDPTLGDISSLTDSKIRFLAPVVSENTAYDLILSVSDGMSADSDTVPIIIRPYKPDLSKSEVTNIFASSYLGLDIPSNINDGNSATFWSSNGDFQWVICKLRQPFIIDHLKLSFSAGDVGVSLFDIYGSNDSLIWDPLIINAVSCGFSGNLQTFPTDDINLVPYKLVKFVGHGNSLNGLNKLSELKIMGSTVSHGNDLIEINMTVYPNPAERFINILFDKSPIGEQVIRVLNLLGDVAYEACFFTGQSYLQIPISFPPGIYFIQLISNKKICGSSKVIVQK